jgi:hypothetical protein
MALPKKIRDLFNKKDDFIQASRNKMESDVAKLQDKLLTHVLKEIVPDLDTKDGNILKTEKNIRIIHDLETLYESFAKTNQNTVVSKLGNDIISMNELNKQYFKGILLDNTTKLQFERINKKTSEFINTRVGIGRKGEIFEGGYLDSLIKDRTLLNELKQLTVRAITGQFVAKEFANQISDKIKGNEQVSGGFEKYYKTYVYDTLQESDRAYGKIMADEFKMDYAVYQGGIIVDSREFCIEHNDNVYNREEIADFTNWRDSTGNVPSYISKFPGYDPFIHCGGFNCRHSLSWIPTVLALTMRK